MSGNSCNDLGGSLEGPSIVGKNPRRNSTSRNEALPALKKGRSGQISNKVQMYCSHNTACVQTYPDLLDVTATLDKEGAGKIDASKGEWRRFFHTIKWQWG